MNTGRRVVVSDVVTGVQCVFAYVWVVGCYDSAAKHTTRHYQYAGICLWVECDVALDSAMRKSGDPKGSSVGGSFRTVQKSIGSDFDRFGKCDSVWSTQRDRSISDRETSYFGYNDAGNEHLTTCRYVMLLVQTMKSLTFGVLFL